MHVKRKPYTTLSPVLSSPLLLLSSPLLSSPLLSSLSSLSSLLLPQHLTLHQTWVMWTWINLFEFIVAVPLMLVMLPMSGVPLSHTQQHIHDGLQCMLYGDETKGELCPHSKFSPC